MQKKQYLCAIKKALNNMTIVSTRDFRANQSRFLSMALRGEDVILKSRQGKVRLIPVKEEIEPERDVTTEICQGLKDFRDYLDGDETKLLSWEDMMNEHRQ